MKSKKSLLYAKKYEFMNSFSDNIGFYNNPHLQISKELMKLVNI